MAEFLQAIDYVLINEGGYCNNPKDPGGATNFGILQRDWPQVEIAKITRDQAIAWYQPNYWDKMPYATVTSQQVATKLLDMHVNLGPGAAVKIAQKALGFPDQSVDGLMGPHTVAAINAADPAKFLADLTSLLVAHYKQLEQANPDLVAFDHGWIARATKLPPADSATNPAAA